MSVLRNLEAKLGGPRRGRVRPRLQDERPAGRAGAQARQGDGGQQDGLRLAHLRAEPVPRLPLPSDREQFASYEPALRKELSDYLLEHARQEGLALISRPQIEFQTDDRLGLGEFGIQAQLLGAARGGASRAASRPSAGDFGHTMVYSPDRDARGRSSPSVDRAPGAARRRGPAQRARRRARA